MTQFMALEVAVMLAAYVLFQFLRAVWEVRTENRVGTYQHDVKTIQEFRRAMKVLGSTPSHGSTATISKQQEERY